MLPGKEKENDPAVAWHGSQRILNHPNSGSHRLPAPASVTGLGGTCYADTLQVWFATHWAPVVFQQLQQKEDGYRAENPSWMDQEVAPTDIRKQWQEARANRSSKKKPVELYLAALPTLKQGHCWGFQAERCCPLGITRAEKLQLSVFLPNDLSLEDWYAGVIWPTNCVA